MNKWTPSGKCNSSSVFLGRGTSKNEYTYYWLTWNGDHNFKPSWRPNFGIVCSCVLRDLTYFGTLENIMIFFVILSNSSSENYFLYLKIWGRPVNCLQWSSLLCLKSNSIHFIILTEQIAEILEKSLLKNWLRTKFHSIFTRNSVKSLVYFWCFVAICY